MNPDPLSMLAACLGASLALYAAFDRLALGGGWVPRAPTWWPWVSRRRLSLSEQERRSSAHEAHMYRGAMRRAQDECDAALAEVERLREELGNVEHGYGVIDGDLEQFRAEVERLRKIIRETWRRFDSANDAITDQLIWLDAEMQGWANES